MKLYLLRHGLAEARSAGRRFDDSQRALTAEGRQKTRGLAQGLKALGITFDAVLSSPYLRARQTAAIIVERLGTPEPVILIDALAPEGDPRELVVRLRRLHGGTILLVGHEPSLSQFISVLLTGKPDLPLELKKGGLCRLRLGTLRYGRCAVLEALLTPRHWAPFGKQ